MLKTSSIISSTKNLSLSSIVKDVEIDNSNIDYNEIFEKSPLSNNLNGAMVYLTSCAKNAFT